MCPLPVVGLTSHGYYTTYPSDRQGQPGMVHLEVSASRILQLFVDFNDKMFIQSASLEVNFMNVIYVKI
jgi:hypothetical protein